MKKTTLVLAALTLGLGVSSLQAGYPELKKCAGCHGQTFEKKALGKSKVVSNMSEDDIRKALEGYADGTYGGPMKGVMKMQVKGIKDFEDFSKKVYVTSGHEVSEGNTTVKKKVITKKTFEEKKEICGAKLEKINKLFSEAKSPKDMKKVKIEILKIAKHIEDTQKAKGLKQLMPNNFGESCPMN